MLPVFRTVIPGVLLTAIALTSVNGEAQGTNVSPREHAQRANEYLKTNQPDKAIPEFAALVAVQPENVDAQANLGVLLYFQHRYAGAEEHLRRAVQLSPGLSKIQTLLGLCEHQLGHNEAARNDLAAALRMISDPKLRKEAGLTLIEIETNLQDLAGAAVTVQMLRETAPADSEILYAAYRIHTDLAGEALLSLSLAAPQSGQMMQAIAHELERVRDLPGAIASFRKAIAADPNLPGIHFELAEALHGSDSQSDRAQAEQEYALALEKNPNEVHAATRLAELHADRSELDEAIGLYQAALALQPDNVDALIGEARIYSEKNENEKALTLLQRAMELDPSNILARFRLSALYRKLRRPDDAKRELAEYQKYKAVKDGLRQVYSTMRLEVPGRLDNQPGDSKALGEDHR